MRAKTVVLIVFVVIGVLIMALGIYLFNKDKKEKDACSKKLQGKVIGYTSNKIPSCIVEYEYNGKRYKLSKSYTKVKSISPLMSVKDFEGHEDPVYLDEFNTLHIKQGVKIDYMAFVEKKWPIQSKATVYIDPDHPENGMMEPVNHKPKFSAMLCIWLGVLIIVVVECIHMVIR